MNIRLRWPIVVAASAVLMGLLLAADVGGPIRLLVALWFMFFCPGLALVPLFSMRSRGEVMVLAFVLSIIIDTLVATVIAVIGGLSATSGFFALAAICLTGCTLQVLRPSEIGGGTLTPSSDPHIDA